MSRDFRDEGLAVISLSADEEQAPALDFLKAQGADFDNLIIDAGLTVDGDFGVKTMPFYKLYDRKGELRYQFTPFPSPGEGFVSTDEMDQRVEELLAENQD